MVYVGFVSASKTTSGSKPKKTNQNTSPRRSTNILILLTDDQDVLLGSFDTKAYMPILHERLRQKGVTFEKGGLVHVPICCPSRSSLLTGKYLHHGSLAVNNSVPGNCYSDQWKSAEEDHHTLAVHAQASGYTTLYAGKYLNRYQHRRKSSSNTKDNTNNNIDSDIDDDSIPKGWDYWYGLEGNSRYYNYTIVERKPNNNDSNISNSTDIDNNKKKNHAAAAAAAAAATIRLHKHGDSYPEDYLPLVLEEYTMSVLPTLPEPWLAVVAWPTPHGPFTPEPKYSQAYPDAMSRRDSDFNATDGSQMQKHWLLRKLGVISNTTATTIEDIYRNRLRALKTVDNHVGKLLDWLEQEESNTTTTTTTTTTNGETEPDHERIQVVPRREHLQSQPPMIDRTLIIYTSDNGFQFGQHRLSIDKRHLYEHDVRVPFVVRGPKGLVAAENVTIPKETIVSTIDIAPTVLEIVLEGLINNNNNNIGVDDEEQPSTDAVGGEKKGNSTVAAEIGEAACSRRLYSAIEKMDGLSFLGFLKRLPPGNNNNNNNSSSNSLHEPTTAILEAEARALLSRDDVEYDDDPFVRRTDLLISYHGEGNPKCGLSECPAPLDGLWWMPDSYNNTYHCVRTLRKATSEDNRNKKSNANTNRNGNDNGNGSSNDDAIKTTKNSSDDNIYQTADTASEDSIYCVFYDDEDFVEYYDLQKNPHQLGNDYESLSETAIEHYERRLQDLLS